jgi:hypothetical protein
MKTLVFASLVTLGLTACEPMEGEELASLEEGITGGVLVPSNDSNGGIPASVVRLKLPLDDGPDDGTAPDGHELCSGTRISSLRYLTAAHCLTDSSLDVNDVIEITNELDGRFIETYVVRKIFLHPSWDLVDDGDAAELGRDRDLAVIEIDRAT